MSAEPNLDRSLRAHFAPKLREVGFKGSSRTYRRTRDGLIEIVNVQGSKYGGMFAINLAVHPVGVQALSEGATEQSIKEYECGFRCRLSESGGDFWWSTGGTQERMDDAVRDAAAAYARRGAELFDRVGGEHSPLALITPAAFAAGDYDTSGFGSVPAHTAIILMRWRIQQDRIDEAKGFARAMLVDMRDDFFWRQEIEATLSL